MRFGPARAEEAAGAILAHGAGPFKKGRRLDAEDVAVLRAQGVERVVIARLEEGDVHEDEAAAALAAALLGDGLEAADAFTGRANLSAGEAGLLRVDRAKVDAINAIDEAITLATLEDRSVVEPGRMVATVKIIPFAAPRAALDRALALAEGAMRIAPFAPLSAMLVQSRSAKLAPKVLDKTARITAERMEAIGGALAGEIRCDHDEAAIGAAIGEALARSPDLLLIAGAQAIADRADAIPAAVLASGGRIERFGMPVDPGNLLLLASIGEVSVVGLPGCARSPKLNGLDWILARIAAREPVSDDDVRSLGVGGLLSEIPSRPQPRRRKSPAAAAREPATEREIGAVLLAAGRSSRMPGDHKLLRAIDGEPLVRRSARRLLAAGLGRVVVVTGARGEEVARALDGLDLEIAHNPDWAKGLSASIGRGIEALEAGARVDGALIALADMPEIGPAHIATLIGAFAPEEGRSIVVPAREGKRGNPALFAAELFSDLAALEGDVGAKALIASRPEQVIEVECDDDAPFLDLDTEAAWAAFRAGPGG